MLARRVARVLARRVARRLDRRLAPWDADYEARHRSGRAGALVSGGK